ncbi:MAG: hypothetical protein M3137_05080 [Actinomycetota bacterium]|nr:hypothetical protein [Actinomycetota bacterium]
MELSNSNCTWCRDALVDQLRTRPLVQAVHVNSTAGCLVVDHDHDSPKALVADVHRVLRGWELADNGERVMVTLDVHEAAHCAFVEGGRSSEAG